jgi:hypothetical protein
MKVFVSFLRAACVLFLMLGCVSALKAQSQAPQFHVLALAEKGGIHKPFVDAAKLWLAQEAVRDHFIIDYIENTDPINDAFLAHYQLFIQLNYPPYNWTPAAVAAFQRYIEEGRGGWIGFHHATLLGHFDGFGLWPWFSDFMGGIQFKDYIATFASATVHVENEEWYTWDKDPRPNVHVLATVDENSYTPATTIKMGGDHPVIWTNEHMKARNIYIFMGHHPELFQNKSFTTLFHNSILWAAHA